MPVYAYKCSDCNTKFDVYHKTIEQENVVKCPTCNSENNKRLISAANFGGFSTVKSSDAPAMTSCTSGMCGLN